MPKECPFRVVTKTEKCKEERSTYIEERNPDLVSSRYFQNCIKEKCIVWNKITKECKRF